MNEVMYQGTYSQFKVELDAEIRSAADSFVRIGYLLKVARDTDVLSQSGYSSVAEFAKAEYGLTKDVVSRWIDINDKYSEGGYGERLQERYRGFGVAKLAEMITLPDVIAEQIPEEMTRREIQDIKKDIKEEKSVSDLEVMMEPEQKADAILENMLEKALYEHFKEVEAFKRMYQITEEEVLNRGSAMEIIAPNGMANIRPRIPGVGRVMIAIKDIEEPIILTNIRTMQVEKYMIDHVVVFLEKITPLVDTWQQAYELVYGSAPEKTEVAPVQQIAEKPVNTNTEPAKAQEVKAQEAEAQKTEAQVFEAQELKAQAAAVEREEKENDHSTGTDVLGGAGDAGESGITESIPGEETGNGGQCGVESGDEGAGECSGSTETDLWYEVRQAHDALTKYLMVYGSEEADTEKIEKMYAKAVDLTAGLEKIMLSRKGN